MPLTKLSIAIIALAMVAAAQVPSSMIFGDIGQDCGGTTPGHTGMFSAQSFSFDSTNASSIVTSRSAGAPNFGDIVVTRFFDRCTPKLFEAMAKGTHIPTVKFLWSELPSSSLSRIDWMTITLEDVLVTSVKFGTTQDSISFAWSKITIKLTIYRDDGSIQGSVTTSWDRTTGR